MKTWILYTLWNGKKVNVLTSDSLLFLLKWAEHFKFLGYTCHLKYTSIY